MAFPAYFDLTNTHNFTYHKKSYNNLNYRTTFWDNVSLMALNFFKSHGKPNMFKYSRNCNAAVFPPKYKR